MRALAILLVTASAVACGSNGSSLAVQDGGIVADATPPNDAAGESDAPRDALTDASPDAPIDAATPPDAEIPPNAAITFNDGGGTTNAVAVGDTLLGTTTTATIFVINSGANETGAISPFITGTNAAEFAITSTGTTCGSSLVPGDICKVVVAFTPAVAGSRDAALVISTASLGEAALPLSSTAVVAPTTGLSFDRASLQLNSGNQFRALLYVTNTSSTTITVTATTTGPFYLPAYETGSFSIYPGDTVYEEVDAILGEGVQGLFGVFDGQLTLLTSTEALTVPLELTSLDTVQVSLAGSGSGQVSSFPSGIQCGSSCSAEFPVGVHVNLSENATTPAVFTGWGGSCANVDPTCELAGGVAIANFGSSGLLPFTMNIEGSAPGQAMVNAQVCTHTCTTFLPAGTAVTLDEYSTSSFGGWSNGCSGSDEKCNWGSLTSAGSATATFDLDAGEVGAWFPDYPVFGIAVTPSLDFVVADGNSVRTTDVTGQEIWNRRVDGGAFNVVVDSAGEIFVDSFTRASKLASDGTLDWQIPASDPLSYRSSINPDIAVSPDGTVVAMLANEGVTIVDNNGSNRVEVQGLIAWRAIAIAPDDTVEILGLTPDDRAPQPYLIRVARDGSILSQTGPFGQEGAAALAVDSSNAAACLSAYSYGLELDRISNAEDITYRESLSGSEGDFDDAGDNFAVTVDGNGNAIAMSQLDNDSASFQVVAYSPSGELTWNLRKNYSQSNVVGFIYPNTIAAGSGTRVVFGGAVESWVSGPDGGDLPFVQIYDHP